MQINLISENNFEGKIKFDKELTKKKLQVLNDILDFKIDNKSTRERIKKATYNLEILNIRSRKAIHPNVLVRSYFKTLLNPDKYYQSMRIHIDNNLEKNANVLNNFLDKFESRKNSYYYSYNSIYEKICAFFNKIFGIRK